VYVPRQNRVFERQHASNPHRVPGIKNESLIDAARRQQLRVEIIAAIDLLLDQNRK